MDESGNGFMQIPYMRQLHAFYTPSLSIQHAITYLWVVVVVLRPLRYRVLSTLSLDGSGMPYV